jgi:hypothetical protein
MQACWVATLVRLQAPAEPHLVDTHFAPTVPTGAEVSAEDAYAWTDGRVVFADRMRRARGASIALPDGRQMQPGAGPEPSVRSGRSCIWSPRTACRLTTRAEPFGSLCGRRSLCASWNDPRT